MTDILTDKNFKDWENEYFGFGYGTGEEHTLKALKQFMENLEDERSYDYKIMESKLTPTVAWLLINILCHADILEYGTSPRYGWLTSKGELLMKYLKGHTPEELYDITLGENSEDEYVPCYREHCNCELGIEACNPLFYLR